MSLFHAKHAKHAKSDDMPDGQGALLSLALMRTRDAIAGTEDPHGRGGSPAMLAPGARLGSSAWTGPRRASCWRQASEDLPCTADCTWVAGASSASLLCRQADGTCASLVRIDRPDLAQFREAAAMVGHTTESAPSTAPL